MSTITRTPHSTIANEHVVLYADGFGRWYARIDFTEPVTDVFLLEHHERLRAKARRAIRRQLSMRQTADLPPVPVEVTQDLFRQATAPDHMNLWWSITYAEKEQ